MVRKYKGDHRKKTGGKDINLFHMLVGNLVVRKCLTLIYIFVVPQHFIYYSFSTNEENIQLRQKQM